MRIARRNAGFWLCCAAAAVAACGMGCGGGGTSSSGTTTPPPNPTDQTPPSVNMTAPAAGATLSGTVTISANATDNIGVAGVQFLLDGGTLGAELTAAPYSMAWNTTAATNGAHTLSARARDAAGNQATSAAVNVTVSNTPPPSANVTFSLQSSQRFQTWEAWLGSASGPYFLVSPGMNAAVPVPVLNQLLDDLVFDLGLTGLQFGPRRNPEPVNDNSDPFLINPAGFDFTSQFFAPNGLLLDPVANMERVILPFKQRVESRGDPFVSFVTSIYDYNSLPAHWHAAEEYAEYAEAYLGYLRTTYNFSPTYWAILNEPDDIFVGAGELVNDTISTGRRFQMRGFPTKIISTERSFPDPQTLQQVLSNSTAAPFVGMISYHGYDYFGGVPSSFGPRNSIRDMAAAMGLRTAMTEICCRGWDGSYTGQGLDMARDIFWNLTEANISMWMPLAIMNPCSQPGCPNGQQTIIALDNDLSRTFKFASYYARRQYMRYIRPGYVRVGISCAGCATTGPSVGLNVKTVVFQSPSGKYVAVVLNDQTISSTIALTNFPAGTYDVTGVDPVSTTGVTYATQTISAGQSLTVTFPAQAILTFAQR